MQAQAHLIELDKRLHSLKAKEIMTKSVISVEESMPLADLAEMILTKKISGVPVVDKSGKLAGIITATDLFSLMFMLKTGQVSEHGEKGVINPTVDFAMSSEVYSLGQESSLLDIMNLMWGRNIHTVPIVEGEKLVGVVGRRDVLKHFYKSIQGLKA